MDVMFLLLLSAVVFISIVFVSVFMGRTKKKSPNTTSTLIVAGSGGHTKEILLLAEKLGPSYNPRQYVVASTDTMSIQKIHECEKLRSEHAEHVASAVKSEYTVYTVPRSREVKQSWFTTLFTTLYASMYSLQLVFQLCPQVIICNGPGTCVPLCFAGLILKVLGVTDTKIIYVESICRVTSLSLSAILLYPFADSLIVQWPELATKYPKCKYIGRVV